MPFSETAKIRKHIWPYIEKGNGVDLGCEFDKVHPRCIGVDQHKTDIVDYVENITRLPHFINEQFDWVFSSHAIEDIKDYKSALTEWLRILKPDGHLIIYCPYREYYPKIGTPGANQNHVHDFIPSDFVKTLKSIDSNIWIVTAEVRGQKRVHEFHEYSCLIIARKTKPTNPIIFLDNNHQIGDTLTLLPICESLKQEFPTCKIHVRYDTEKLLSNFVEHIGQQNIPYDLVVHQNVTATEFGEWHRRTSHFTQFPLRVLSETYPQFEKYLPDNPTEPIKINYKFSKAKKQDYVVIATDTFPPRQWIPEKWIELIQWLTSNNIKIKLIGLKCDFNIEPNDLIFDLRGKLSFQESLNILKSAKLLISVDTSFVHFSHIFNVPSVVLMGPSDWSTTLYSTSTPVYRQDSGCVGCYNWTDTKVYEWNSNLPTLSHKDTKKLTGTNLSLYVLKDCQQIMSGVQCTKQIRLFDVQSAICNHLNIPLPFEISLPNEIKEKPVEILQIDRHIPIIVTNKNYKPKNKKTVCLNMIVKNESAVIRRCLDSVKPVIDYWVICDTGSTDNTPQIIKDHLSDIPGELHFCEWKNFAHNRNEALKLSQNKADYSLLIDADEVLYPDPEEYTNLSFEHYNIKMQLGGIKYDRSHLVDNKRNWKYVGVLHEYIACEPDSFTISTLEKTTCMSFPEGSRSNDPRKFQRDAALLQTALVDEPNNDRYVFYLAQSYKDGSDFDNAIKFYTQRSKMGGWIEEVWYSLYQIARCKQLRGDKWPEVVGSYLDAFNKHPTRAEPLYSLCRQARLNGNHHEACLYAERGIKIPYPKHDRLFVEYYIYDFAFLDEFSISLYWIGDYTRSVELCQQLLNSGKIPASDLQRIKQNLEYAKEGLSNSKN